jgi:hypothetical protein
MLGIGDGSKNLAKIVVDRPVVVDDQNPSVLVGNGVVD